MRLLNVCLKGYNYYQVDEIPIFTPQAVRYKLTYRKEDALSLAVDRHTNTLLSSVLNVRPDRPVL